MTVVNEENRQLLARFLKDLEQRGKTPAEVRRAAAEAQHLVVVLADKPVAAVLPSAILTQLLRSRHLVHNTPLSWERLRKIVQRSRQVIEFACEEDPAAYKRIRARVLREDLRLPKRLQASYPRRQRDFYTLGEMRQLAAYDPKDDVVLARAQACACLQYLGGLRVDAVSSLPIGALDLSAMHVRQDPLLGVRTKGGKEATTFLLPGPDLIAVVTRWIAYARAHGGGDAGMVFTVLANRVFPLRLTNNPGNLSRKHRLIKDYRLLCQLAGVPHKGSHAFRRGHVTLGVALCQTQEQLLRLSRNVMHEDLATTLLYARTEDSATQAMYAAVSVYRLRREQNQGPQGLAAAKVPACIG